MSYSQPELIINSLNEICNIINHINQELFKHKKIYNCSINYIVISTDKRYNYRRSNYTNLKKYIDITFNKDPNNSIPKYSIDFFKISS